MTSKTQAVIQFIERQLSAPPPREEDGLILEYHFVDNEEGQNCLNRVFDRLFNEVVRRRRNAVNNETSNKK